LQASVIEEGYIMYGLIPLPVQLEPGPGFCALPEKPVINAATALASEVEVLRLWLQTAFTVHKGNHEQEFTAVGMGSSGTASPGKPSRLHVPALELSLDAALGKPESYTLVVEPAGIRLAAADPAGILRGAATLYQLALSHGCLIPCLTIGDEPRFGWRGFMLDTARNFFKVEFIEKLIDLAAMHKLNRFHWHLSDDQAWRLEIPELPELTARGAWRVDRRFNAVIRRGGSYSPGDVKRVLAYAAARHIEVIPEIDLPGHSTALLASHPELWCNSGHSGRVFEPADLYGVLDGILCAGRGETHDFLDHVFDYIQQAFPSGFIHAGGDEVPKATWLNCDHCRQRMREEDLRDASGALDPDRLQAWFMDRIAQGLATRGRRMVAWDEVVDGGCTKDVIVMAWRSYEHGFRAAGLGYDVVMCPQTRSCYLDHKQFDLEEEPGHLGVCTARDSYDFNPAPESLPLASREHILGGQANLWSELLYFGRQAEYMLFPRLCAIAEALWTPAALKDFDGFSRRLDLHGPRLDALGIQRYRGPLKV
jgi:hexosaminidase